MGRPASNQHHRLRVVRLGSESSRTGGAAAHQLERREMSVTERSSKERTRARYAWMAAVLTAPDFTGTEKAVLQCLAMHRNDQTGRCDPSIDRIARGSAVSARTVKRTLAKAARLSWIDRDVGGGRRITSRYRLKPPNMVATGEKTVTGVSSFVEPETVTGVSPFKTETVTGKVKNGDRAMSPEQDRTGIFRKRGGERARALARSGGASARSKPAEPKAGLPKKTKGVDFPIRSAPFNAWLKHHEANGNTERVEAMHRDAQKSSGMWREPTLYPPNSKQA